MQSMMRVACIAYLVLLTLLLLWPNPNHVIGVHGELPWILRVLMPYDHVLSFAVLAILALSVRWPVPRWGIVLMAAAYGGMTEILQGYTHRHPRLADWFHDLVGVAVGTVLCWTAAQLAGSLTKLRRRRNFGSARASCDQWQVLREVLSHPAAGERSWWS
jgi:hypothetical protein